MVQLIIYQLKAPRKDRWRASYFPQVTRLYTNHYCRTVVYSHAFVILVYASCPYISLSICLLNSFAAQVSIFCYVIILLDHHLNIISSVTFTTDVFCFSNQSIPLSVVCIAIFPVFKCHCKFLVLFSLFSILTKSSPSPWEKLMLLASCDSSFWHLLSFNFQTFLSTS